MKKDNKMRMIWGAAVVLVIIILVVWQKGSSMAPGNVPTGSVSLTGQTPSTPSTSTTSSGRSSQTPLDGKSYRIASYDNTVIPTGENYTVNFAGGKVSAHICNSLSGAYVASSGLFTTRLISTQMACTTPADVNATEQIFKTMLSQISKYAVSGATLTLTGSGHTLVLTQI